MRLGKWWPIVAAVALSVLLGATFSSASAPRSGRFENGWLGTGQAQTKSGAGAVRASDDDGARRVIFVQTTFVDNGDPDGLYQFKVSGPVYNGTEIKKVGFAGVHCTVIAPKKGLVECEGTFNLGADFPGGNQITIQGLSSPAMHWFNAITGGTGRYNEVTGEVEARNIGNTNKIEVIFHLDG